MISFVIPTLNEEKTIERTLRNLLTYSGPREIIISDGGSTDRTVEIARKCSQDIKIVQHTRPNRQTIAEGRNAGSFLATGDFLVEMDADTNFPHINNFFHSIINAFKKNPDIAGATTWFRVYPEDETIFDLIMWRFIGLAALILDNYLGLAITSGGEFQMIRIKAFHKIGGYNKKIIAMEDVEMFSRLRKIGKIHFAKNLCIYHAGRRQHNLGWRRSIYTFILNSTYLLLFKRVKSKTWDIIR